MVVARVLHVIGVLLRVFGVTLLAPAAVAVWYGERSDALGFVLSAGATQWSVTSCAPPMARRTNCDGRRTRRRRGFVARRRGGRRAPLSLGRIRPVDALFEIDVGADDDGRDGVRGLLRATAAASFFWRALTHWLGGMGVIALVRRRAATARDRRPRAVLRRGLGPDRRDADAADSKDRAALWKRLCRADDRRRSWRSGGRHGPVRCGVSTAFATLAAGGVLAAPAVDHGLPESRRRVGVHRLHVPRRRQLRAALPRAARQPAERGGTRSFASYVGSLSRSQRRR